jgi:hypothetical protein
MFKIAHLIFATASNSRLSISVTFHCASSIAYTLMVCYTSICTSMDGFTFTSRTLSSPMSFYNVYASTKCYSTASSSFNSLVNTKFTNVAPGHVCFLAHQLPLLLHKKLIANVPILYISWIIVYTNCILSLYVFPSTHSKDDECDSDLITNNWIFNSLLSLLFSTFLQLLFLSTIPLLPPAFVCAHSSTLPFPLLFPIVFQLHSLHSCCYEFQNFKNAHNFQ